MDFLEAYSIALQHNGDYQAQLYRYKASQSDVWVARSELLPQLSIEGNYGAVEEFRDPTDGPFNGRPVGLPPGVDEEQEDALTIGGLSLQGRSVPIEDDYETGSASVSLEQTLFDRKKWTTVGRSKSLREEARLELLETRETLILDLVAAYTGVLRATDSADISRRELAALAKHRELTLDRYKQGLGTLTDSHEAESRYELVLADTLQSDFETGQSRNQMAVLLGRDVAVLAPLAADFSPVASEQYVTEQGSDIETNDVRLADQRVRSAKYQAKNAKADFWPTLTLVGSSRFRNETFSLLTDENDNYRSEIMLQFELPLFSGFGTLAGSRSARHELEATRASARIARDRARANYLDREASFKTSYLRLMAFQRANLASQNALQLRQKGYLEGLSSNLDLLDALRDSFRAERSYRAGIYDYINQYFEYVASFREIADQDIAFLNSLLAPALLEQESSPLSDNEAPGDSSDDKTDSIEVNNIDDGSHDESFIEDKSPKILEIEESKVLSPDARQYLLSKGRDQKAKDKVRTQLESGRWEFYTAVKSTGQNKAVTVVPQGDLSE